MKPRVGFLGAGWIGRHRLEAVLAADVVDAVAIADPDDDSAMAALKLAPTATRVADLDALLAMTLDGIVIATPSALHAGQTIQALEHGVAVFCQKPLGRTAAEVREVVDAARRADRLLAVDLSYRFTEGMRQLKEHVAEGVIGRVFAVDLTFHNAYGPDKPWFYDAEQSGGGCLIDLGVHLLDLLLWTLEFPKIVVAEGRLFDGGGSYKSDVGSVEDFVFATVELETGVAARLTCSWRAHTGSDAEIAVVFHGATGALAFRNVGGSFYDFHLELRRGTRSELIHTPPDAWGGRAAVDWATRLAAGERFDPAAVQMIDVATALDTIYGRKFPTPHSFGLVRNEQPLL